jgi:hypothetical protein
MIIGLDVQQNFDEDKRHAIEYLSCLKDTTGKRNVVPKAQLLPYGESDEWNQQLLEEYLETLGEVGELTELELHKEELYLRKIIKVVSERSAKQHELEEATGTEKTFFSSDPYVEPEAYPESEPEVKQRIPAPPSIMDNHKTVPRNILPNRCQFVGYSNHPHIVLQRFNGSLS